MILPSVMLYYVFLSKKLLNQRNHRNKYWTSEVATLFTLVDLLTGFIKENNMENQINLYLTDDDFGARVSEIARHILEVNNGGNK